jgi:multidrug efflux pump subunit AcrA (membrane-fusion protein)
MKFIDVSEYRKSASFFMLRQSPVYSIFIIILVSILSTAFFWAAFAQMDDVVKATALLRPIGAISLIRISTSGELLQKGYAHNDYVNAGTLLLKIDVTSDIIELDNSQKLMVRIADDINSYNTLLETIRNNNNVADGGANEDAYLWAEAYLLEYHILLNGIEELSLSSMTAYYI